LPEFDATEYLDSEQAIAEYLTVVLEENDPALLAAALGDMPEPWMSDIARDSGLNPRALYKALRQMHARLIRSAGFCAAGVRLVAQPIHS